MPFFTRLVLVADALLLLVPLIENPPWTRRNSAKQWEKFIEQKWQEVAFQLGEPPLVMRPSPRFKRPCFAATGPTY